MRYIITSMLQDLQEYKNDRSLLMQKYIEQRLDKSFNLYTKELSQSIEILTSKHEKSLIKRMSKINGKPN